MIIREQRTGDQAAVREVILEAFGETKVVDLFDVLAAQGALSYVAEAGGEVVGHVALSGSWIDAEPSLVEVLVLSPLSVLPSHQRQGIGGRLVRHAIAAAEQAGVPALFLEGSPAYYSRFGFQPAAAHGFTKPSVRIPDAAFQVVQLPAHEPWMTGAFVYRDAFWALDCVGLR
ncbi:MAG TPA: N-acetyltransferase [Candidatus Limnocylindrales bacterium]